MSRRTCLIALVAAGSAMVAAAFPAEGQAGDALPRITVGTPASRTDWKQTRRETVYTPGASTVRPAEGAASGAATPGSTQMPNMAELAPLIEKMSRQAKTEPGTPPGQGPDLQKMGLTPEMIEQMRRMTKQAGFQEALQRMNPQEMPTGGRQQPPAGVGEMMRRIQQQQGQPAGGQSGNLIDALRGLDGVVDERVMPMLEDIKRDMPGGSAAAR